MGDDPKVWKNYRIMLPTVMIILILSLVLISIIVSAFQRHKNKLEANRRIELSKQKGIIDINEAALSVAEKIPISQRLIFIM